MGKKSFNYTIEPWITTSEQVEYTTKIFKVLSREMMLETENHSANFSIIDSLDWTNVMALTPDNEIILVEQYRYGIKKSTLEFPGGICDEGEEPMESSKRELLEETGFSSTNWVSLGNVSSNSAMLNNYTHFYLARNCIQTSQQRLDGNERINVHTMPLIEFLDMVRRGDIEHSLVVAAVAKFLLSEFS